MYKPLNVAAYAVLTPAYGRRPADQLTAAREYRVGLDWIFLNPTNMNHGRYCSIRDIPADKMVELRYGMHNERMITARGMDNPRLLILAKSKRQYNKWCKEWEISPSTHICVLGLDNIPENFSDGEFLPIYDDHVLMSSPDLVPEAAQFDKWRAQNRVSQNYLLDPIMDQDPEDWDTYVQGIQEALGILKDVQDKHRKASNG